MNRRGRKKTKNRGTGNGPGNRAKRRFPGLVPAILALSIVSAILAIIYVFPGRPTMDVNRPAFEDFRPAPVTPPPAPEKILPAPQRPMVAIIIDDMGYDFATDEALINIEAPLSFAFLPFAPNTKRLAATAKKRGHDILVHLPLEAMDRSMNPGPGTLRLDMDFDTVLRILRRDLDAVPGATGVNNHMGSKFTTDRKAMEWVLAEVKRRNMFFIDSRTTKDTIALETARAMGIPSAARTVFLDHTLNVSSINRELSRLVQLAQKRGKAIAIGHPSRITLKVLYCRLPDIRKKVKLVPVHEIL